MLFRSAAGLRPSSVSSTGRRAATPPSLRGPAGRTPSPPEAVLAEAAGAFAPSAPFAAAPLPAPAVLSPFASSAKPAPGYVIVSEPLALPKLSELDSPLYEDDAMRLRGPHRPTGLTPMQARIAPPAEAMARLMGVLEEAKAIHPNELITQWAGRVFDSYLAAPNDLALLVALGQGAAGALRARGMVGLSQRCEQEVSRALRDPGPTLRQLHAVIESQLRGNATAFAPTLQMWASHTQATMVALPSFAQAPAASMSIVSALLADFEQRLAQGREPIETALEVLERRSQSMTQKIENLANLEELLQLGTMSPAAMSISQARWRLQDASALESVFNAWTSTGMVPHAFTDQDTTFEQLLNRTVSVYELGRFATDASNEMLATLQDAVFVVPADLALFAALPEGHNLHRHAARLDARDVEFFRDCCAQGLDFLAALASWLNVASEPTMIPIDAAVRVDMQNRLRLDLARALVEAKSILFKNDVLQSLHSSIEALATQIAPAATERNDAFHQRAFETLLVARLIEHCPTSTLTAWTELGRTFSAYLRSDQTYLSESVRHAVEQTFRSSLQSRGYRPWDDHSAAMSALLQGAFSLSDQAVMQMATEALDAPAQTGYDVVAKANLLRDLWVVLSRTENGLYSMAPQQSQTNTEYSNLVIPQRDRVRNLFSAISGVEAIGSGPNSQREGAGIMALHQPLPESDNTIPATQPGLSDVISIDTAGTRSALAQGAAVVTGVSGSTNILLHLFDWAKQLPNSPVSATHQRDIALGAMQFLVHDGGHSMYEVMWVFDRGMNGKHQLSDPSLPPQSLAQLRRQFADEPGVQMAFEQSAHALSRFDAELRQYKPIGQ